MTKGARIEEPGEPTAMKVDGKYINVTMVITRTVVESSTVDEVKSNI
jgi:hypothetical protein